MTDQEAAKHINDELMRLHSLANKHNVKMVAFVDADDSPGITRAMICAPGPFMTEVVIALAQHDRRILDMAVTKLEEKNGKVLNVNRIRNPNDDYEFTAEKRDL